MCAPPSSHSSTAEHPKTLTFASCVGRPKQSEDRAPPLPEELATKLGSGQPLSEGERKIGTLSNSMHLEDGDSDFTCTRACYAVWVDMADESGTPCESANSLASRSSPSTPLASLIDTMASSHSSSHRR